MNITEGHFAPLSPQVFHILLALKFRPEYGYGIKTRIAQDSQGTMLLTDSTVYTALKRLAAKGWIEAYPENNQTFYQITKAGDQAYAGEYRRLKELVGVADRRALSEKYGTREQFS